MATICPVYRAFGYTVIALFLFNLLFIIRFLNWQLPSHPFNRKDGRLNDDNDIDNDDDDDGIKKRVTVTQLTECDLSGSLIKSALSRMRTEGCRAAARDIVCSIDRVTPDSLPNSCPQYDEVLRDQYVGCYEDSPNTRLLNEHLYKLKNNSPVYCVNMCLRAGYRFAGIEYRDECFCGDVLADAVSLPVSSCEQYQCDNEKLFCGGYNATAVYRTGIIEKPMLVVNYSEPDHSVPNVQILFLLQLNGRNIRQINRLLRIIYSPKHYYIIHVDSRQQFMFDAMKELVSAVHSAGFNNVYLMEKRYATIWAGAALLSMVLDVLRTALYSLKWTNWDFLLNLSESDFPVLSMNELEFHLAKNKGRNFLSTHGYDTARFIQKQGLEYVFMQCENRMWRLVKRSKFPKSIRLDGGSDWIIISREFAEYALSDKELPRSFRQFFANVLLPVESFFHTLAANSEFCTRTVKGNLHLTNWKRRQGCRCAMLRDVVDWCGCSPLVLRSSDVMKFSVKVAQSKPVFFGRKFDPMISQQAIAIAEAQALRFADDSSDRDHRSLQKSWINVYLSRLDRSALLENFARKLYQTDQSCTFQQLLSITAYKENDEAHVQNIYKSSYDCNGEIEFVQVLMEQNNLKKFADIIVDGYELQSLEIGAGFDLKEEIFRKYHGILSEADAVSAKLVWRRIESLPTSVSVNRTSPEVIAEWKNANGMLIKRETIQPYDSIYGGQYAQLFPNETSPGEWVIDFILNENENASSTAFASITFVIFAAAAEDIDNSLISKFFSLVDVCSEANVIHLRNCLETPWSPNFSDLKFRLFF